MFLEQATMKESFILLIAYGLFFVALGWGGFIILSAIMLLATVFYGIRNG